MCLALRLGLDRAHHIAEQALAVGWCSKNQQGGCENGSDERGRLVKAHVRECSKHHG